MSRRTAFELSFVLGAIVLASFFVVVPEVDLQLAAAFYDPARGFYLDGAWWVQFFYKLVPILTVTISLGLFALLAHNLFRKKGIGPFSTRAVLYLLAALALGPGLVVQTLAKDQWGRARPRDVAEFGGDKTFTPAFVISDQCERNCSFVAGHPSVGFYFLAFALMARRRRRQIYGGAIIFGAAIGFGRIAQGAHFLSDVVFSGIVVFVVAYLLYRYAFRLGSSTSIRAA